MYRLRIDNGRGQLVTWCQTITREAAYAVRDELHEEHLFNYDDMFIENV